MSRADDRRPVRDEIAEELAALRRPAPYTIDVSERVMARVATMPLPARAVLRPAIARWSALAAAAAAVVSLAGLLSSWPAARAAIATSVVHAASLIRSALGSSTTVASASRRISGSLEVAGSTATSLATALEPLRPVVTALSLALAAVTVAAMLAVVLRDLYRAPALEER